MEITFVRHAESESNVTGRWQGQGDSRLSDSGEQQARALGKRLAGEHFDLVLCSDLSRCCETGAALGFPLETAVAWREIDVGRWEGLTRAEVAEKFPEEVARLSDGALDVPVGGGESWLDLYRRVDAAMDELRARLEPGKRALVVTHGGVIHSLVAGLLHLRDSRPRPIGRIGNTALTTLRFGDDGATTLVRYNDSGHLGPIGQWVAERIGGANTVLTLVAHSDDEPDHPPPDERVGRARGNRLMTELEQLASWYPTLHRVYAPPDARLRNAAAVLAERHRASLWDGAIDPQDLVGALAGDLPTRVGIVAGARDLAAAIAGVLGGRAEVTPARHASIAHVVRTPLGATLGDYGVFRPRNS